MLRVGLAPCSPFTVTSDLMKNAASMARSYEGVRLHTHLAENQVMLLLLKFADITPRLNTVKQIVHEAVSL